MHQCHNRRRISCQTNFLYEFNNHIGQHILENERPSLYKFLYSQVQRDHRHSREYITDELKQVAENLLKAISLGYSEATQLTTKKSKSNDQPPLKTPAAMTNPLEYKEVFCFITTEFDGARLNINRNLTTFLRKFDLATSVCAEADHTTP